MPAYYFDASALVKCYVNEIGTPRVRALVNPAAENDIYVLRLVEVEVASAVTRRARAGSLSATGAADILSQFRSDLADEFFLIEVTASLLFAAANLAESHGLRAYDAVHLAAVLELDHLRRALTVPALTLVSADQELNAAAVSEGLAVEDPNAGGPGT